MTKLEANIVKLTAGIIIYGSTLVICLNFQALMQN